MTELLHSAEFWALVAFVIFVVGIFKPARRALTGALDQRIEAIRTQVEEAKRLREEAQAALANYQRKQRQATQEADAIIERAREEAERHREEAEATLKAVLKRQEAQALEKIAQAEVTALREVRETAVDLAIAATGELLSEKLKGPEGSALIDDAIEGLPEKLN
jgi:F-type H+-transporting ATPase subunit b